MKMISLSLLALTTVGLCASAAPTGEHAVTLTQDPLVMRLSNNEFRIAFGINGELCASNGCNGSIRYTVDWKTADGITRTEVKQVSYAVPARANRSIAVDRQYFDTAEGAHTTNVVRVRVEKITCRDTVA